MLIIISSSYHPAYITHRAPLRYFYPSSAPRLSSLLLLLLLPLNHRSISLPHYTIFNSIGTTHHGVAQSGPVSGSFRHGFPRVKVAYQYNNSSQCTRMTGVRFGSSALNLILSSVHGGFLYIRASLLSCPAMRDHERTTGTANEA